MIPITSARLRVAITDTLSGVPAVGAFVYGSVACGRATEASDLDTFVLLAEDIGQQCRRTVSDLFVQLQRGLGLVPDVNYPVELFSVNAVTGALAAVELACANGIPDTLSLDGDEREVLRALTAPRLSVLNGPELECVTGKAWRLTGLLPTETTG